MPESREKAFNNGVFTLFTQTFDYQVILEEPVVTCRKPFLLGFFEKFQRKVKHFLDKKYFLNEGILRFSKGFVGLLIKRLVGEGKIVICQKTLKIALLSANLQVLVTKQFKDQTSNRLFKNDLPPLTVEVDFGRADLQSFSNKPG